MRPGLWLSPIVELVLEESDVIRVRLHAPKFATNVELDVEEIVRPLNASPDNALSPFGNLKAERAGITHICRRRRCLAPGEVHGGDDDVLTAQFLRIRLHPFTSGACHDELLPMT